MASGQAGAKRGAEEEVGYVRCTGGTVEPIVGFCHLQRMPMASFGIQAITSASRINACHTEIFGLFTILRRTFLGHSSIEFRASSLWGL